MKIAVSREDPSAIRRALAAQHGSTTPQDAQYRSPQAPAGASPRVELHSLWQSAMVARSRRHAERVARRIVALADAHAVGFEP